MVISYLIFDWCFSGYLHIGYLSLRDTRFLIAGRNVDMRSHDLGDKTGRDKIFILTQKKITGFTQRVCILFPFNEWVYLYILFHCQVTIRSSNLARFWRSAKMSQLEPSNRTLWNALLCVEFIQDSYSVQYINLSVNLRCKLGTSQFYSVCFCQIPKTPAVMWVLRISGACTGEGIKTRACHFLHLL